MTSVTKSRRHRRGIDIDPGDRYVVNGVILSEHAYSARQHPLQGWLTRFAFTPEKGSRKPKNGPARTEQGIMNPVKALENHGQAVWLDFLARGFVAKGDLKKLIDTDGVKGVTSNPSIFEKAIGRLPNCSSISPSRISSMPRTYCDRFMIS